MRAKGMVARRPVQRVPVRRVLANYSAPDHVMLPAKAMVAPYTVARRAVRQRAWALVKRVALLPVLLFVNVPA